MSLIVRAITVFVVICFISAEVFGDGSPSQRLARRFAQDNFYDSELSNLDDPSTELAGRDLLGALLTRPSKRQWCRKGMTYNHVLGSCTLSFAAMRGKGRRQ